MIAQISGTVVENSVSRVVVAVGGVGYEVLVPLNLTEQLVVGSEVSLLTHHHVRENVQELYGFDQALSKELFELLIGVSGVGPKSALMIMGLAEQTKIRQAISSGDTAWLATAPGVGKRTAERITVELKDKVGVVDRRVNGVETDDARSALMALGYSASQAAQALADVEAELPTEERVRKALKQLS
jgi:Holliday junction DNA helicase RuvA